MSTIIEKNTISSDQELLDAANNLLNKETASDEELYGIALIILQKWAINKNPGCYEVVNNLKKKITNNVKIELLDKAIRKIAQEAI